MGRLAVVTAVFGTVKDRILPPFGFEPTPDVDYFCFTDRPSVPAPYALKAAGWVDPSSRRTARYYKLLPHRFLSGYDHIVWHDACLQLKADPRAILAEVAVPGWSGLAAFKHPHRSCLYEEVKTCKRFRKDNAHLLQKQADWYRYCGHPLNAGLAETACLVRANTDPVRDFSERWWQAVQNFSARDQVSFPFVAAERGVTWSTVPGCRNESPYFVFHPHVHHGDRR